MNIIELIIKGKVVDDEFPKLMEYYNGLGNAVAERVVQDIIQQKTPAFKALKSLIDFYRRYGLDELLPGDVEEV